MLDLKGFRSGFPLAAAKFPGRNVTRVVTGESCSSVGRVIVSEAANRATKASVTSHLNDIVGRISVYWVEDPTVLLPEFVTPYCVASLANFVSATNCVAKPLIVACVSSTRTPTTVVNFLPARLPANCASK